MQEVKIYGGDYGVTDDGRVISYKRELSRGSPSRRSFGAG